MLTPNSEFWKIFKETPGALSCAEAVCLLNLVEQSPDGIFLELGSHKGKSSQAISLSFASKSEGSGLVLVEPEFVDSEWLDGVVKKVGKLLPKGGFCYRIDYSLNVIPTYDFYSFVFIDSGSHSDELVMNECLLLEDKMAKGGIISFHDKGSQFTKVDEAYNYLLSTGKYEEIKIDWQEIFDYVAEHNLEEGNNSWHIYPELPHPPNFIGALRRL